LFRSLAAVDAGQPDDEHVVLERAQGGQFVDGFGALVRKRAIGAERLGIAGVGFDAQFPPHAMRRAEYPEGDEAVESGQRGRPSRILPPAAGEGGMRSIRTKASHSLWDEGGSA